MKKMTSLCLAILLVALCGVPALAEMEFFSFTSPEDEPDDTATIPEDDTPSEPVWSYPIPMEILEDPLDLLVLTNKENLLDKDYPPDDDLHKLVPVGVKKTKNNDYNVREIVRDALVLMFADAEADGANLRVHSAYRSYRTQATMYENRLKSKGYDDGVVQAPGASDHQTGLCVDVINMAWLDKKLNSEFAKTTEGQWMGENCAKYGFIIRYLQGEDKEAITGIIYEPWHLRYVGVEVATYMMSNNLTLEEFTEEARQAILTYQQGGGTSGEAVVDSFSF